MNKFRTMNNIHCKPYVSSCHLGLEPHSPAYSNLTIKRALIMWFLHEQQNDLQHVCDYYHRVESMELKLSAEERVSSRAVEFNLLSSPLPISAYHNDYFPNLYRSYKINEIDINEIQEITEDNGAFNFERFHDMTIRKRAKIHDVIKTITMYSKIHSKPLRILLTEFQDFANKTKTANSLEKILMYIQKLFLKDELITWVNIPKTFDFLDEDEQYTDNVSRY